jgi:hypothetical protein
MDGAMLQGCRRVAIGQARQWSPIRADAEGLVATLGLPRFDLVTLAEALRSGGWQHKARCPDIPVSRGTTDRSSSPR